jgi:hypothetical protein
VLRANEVPCKVRLHLAKKEVIKFSYVQERLAVPDPEKEPDRIHETTRFIARKWGC